jgi:hypothetical protein
LGIGRLDLDARRFFCRLRRRRKNLFADATADEDRGALRTNGNDFARPSKSAVLNDALQKLNVRHSL